MDSFSDTLLKIPRIFSQFSPEIFKNYTTDSWKSFKITLYFEQMAQTTWNELNTTKATNASNVENICLFRLFVRILFV